MLLAATLAADPWTSADTAWEAGFAALVLVDYGQTRWGLERGRSERNPLLGSTPDRAKLSAACLAAVVAHAGVSYLLPRDWRRFWQAFTITAEAAAVGGNVAITGGVHFAW